MLRQTYHGHTIAMVDVLVEFPRSTKEGADSRYRTSVPSNGQLSSFPLKPKHQFLRRSRSEISFRAAKDEIEADVA